MVVIITLRFIRLPFGRSVILNTKLTEHLESCRTKEENKAVVGEIHDNLFADDLTLGGYNTKDSYLAKNPTNLLFATGGLTLHKWCSNITSLEISTSQEEDKEASVTFAKEHT